MQTILCMVSRNVISGFARQRTGGTAPCRLATGRVRPNGCPRLSASRAWWEPLVKHQIHEHARDRDVKPDRDRPTRDSLMTIPSATKNLDKCDNHQGQRDKGKQNVRSQYRKVNSGEPPCVSRGFFADIRVINDVARQETDRGSDGGDHARHMPAPRATPNEVPAH
jgi:hypothetical protein